MPQTSLDPLLTTIVLATLAIGLPIVLVLAIRFLWDRNLKLERSKELEKLIWQLHRIATAMEHQQRLSFPAVQPGTEEAHDLAYLSQIPVQPARPAAPAKAAAPAAAPAYEAQTSVGRAVAQPAAQTVASEVAATQASAVPASVPQEPAPQPPLRISPDTRRHGVNSMFDL